MAIVTVTNLIFKASCPRLKLSSVSLFDWLKANSIPNRFLLGHLVGEHIIINYEIIQDSWVMF